MWCSSEGGEEGTSLCGAALRGERGAHHCLVQHTFPFMYLCLLPEDGRMERQKHIVVGATK